LAFGAASAVDLDPDEAYTSLPVLRQLRCAECPLARSLRPARVGSSSRVGTGC